MSTSEGLRAQPGMKNGAVFHSRETPFPVCPLPPLLPTYPKFLVESLLERKCKVVEFLLAGS